MTRSSDDEAVMARLREALMRQESSVPTSGLSRLLKTGRAAVGTAAATLGGRLRGRGEGLAAIDEATLRGLVTQLGELKGVAMKAGQILSYIDPTLTEQARSMLGVLQTASPASPSSEVERTVRACLGDRADALLGSMDPRPIAVASIGQVHRATLPGGAHVAVKVRHPGIVEALRADFRAAGAGASFAGTLLGVGAAGDFVKEAERALLEECDFTREAQRQSQFAALFARDETIVIPSVVAEYCGDAVLTTHWNPGQSLDEFIAGDPPQAERDRVGAALFRFYVGSLYRHGLFHADPHPGNYAFGAGGSVVVYDFGCVREFDRATVRALAALVAAVRRDDADAIGAALAAIGGRLPRSAAERDHVRAMMRGFFAPLLRPGVQPVAPGAGFELREVMKDKRALGRLSLPGQLLFLFRLRFGLYAILARLGARADWAQLESGWAAEVSDPPSRVSPPPRT